MPAKTKTTIIATRISPKTKQDIAQLVLGVTHLNIADYLRDLVRTDLRKRKK